MNPKTKALAESAPPRRGGPLAEWKPGASVLDAFAKVNDLLTEDTYDDEEKAAMVELQAGPAGLVRHQASEIWNLRAAIDAAADVARAGLYLAGSGLPGDPKVAPGGSRRIARG